MALGLRISDAAAEGLVELGLRTSEAAALGFTPRDCDRAAVCAEEQKHREEPKPLEATHVLSSSIHLGLINARLLALLPVISAMIGTVRVRCTVTQRAEQLARSRFGTYGKSWDRDLYDLAPTRW